MTMKTKGKQKAWDQTPDEFTYLYRKRKTQNTLTQAAKRVS